MRCSRCVEISSGLCSLLSQLKCDNESLGLQVSKWSHLGGKKWLLIGTSLRSVKGEQIDGGTDSDTAARTFLIRSVSFFVLLNLLPYSHSKLTKKTHSFYKKLYKNWNVKTFNHFRDSSPWRLPGNRRNLRERLRQTKTTLKMRKTSK